jgi:acyl-CoA thioesterase-1
MFRFYLVVITVFNAFCVRPALAEEAVAGANETLPRVLILGDSISIGYTPYVQDMLKGEALVVRPTFGDGKPQNCSGTTKGVEMLDTWLALEGGNWDVIHFNWGLHDLKHVDTETGESSIKPEDPRQAEPEVYEKQLRGLVEKLKATGAKLIFATTTPVPKGRQNPLRRPEDVVAYNNIAKKIMAEHNVAINDLYVFALPKLAEIQREANVHFTDEGSETLGKEVVRHLREALAKN